MKKLVLDPIEVVFIGSGLTRISGDRTAGKCTEDEPEDAGERGGDSFEKRKNKNTGGLDYDKKRGPQGE